MKIAVISPSPAHLQEIARIVGGSSHTVLTFEGGKTRVREVAERDHPDMMLVDGICRDSQELAQIEWATAHQPTMAVVLMCSSHTPEFLLGAMRAGVREVLPSPASADAILGAVDRVSAKIKQSPSRRGRVLGFMNCKGGAGATFLSVNLGWHLAQAGKVLLLDLNLQFGDAVSLVHDGKPPTTIADVARDISRLDIELLNASCLKISEGFSLLPAPDDLALASEVRPDHIQAILELAGTHYDFVLLDLPRHLDPLSITALDRADRVFCVLQSALPDLRNANRLVKAFHALGYPDEKLEVIVNRFEKSGEIGIEQVQRAVPGLRVHTISNAWRDVSNSINQGDPLAKSQRGPVVRQLAEMARALTPKSDDPQRGLLGRLFRRA
ncbi:AAA family ATPase [Ramlibacter sp. AW1]|uniref:AAA family ATPase n=1 Tax=Ramlibacter aurantiacus TaxID=2801330 RepID=A0A936ZES3_9BURK|nr:AAA family ATPase [Ramlibacter aurantiacus]MBL0419592.1 AAA family ATPase [Ramlibacter aurantiacus]